MANGDQVQGGQQTGGGQRTYSEEDVMALMNEAAKRAVSEAAKRAESEDDDETSVSVINPKVVKQLKDTVAVFTALKELSSNPLQKTIEETVGGMAASVVQNAFAPRGPPPKQDIVDKVLNSQFAYGLGSGLGQRAPELVESMGRTFGTDKAGQMMDSIIGKYGQGGQSSGQSRQLSPGSSSGPAPSSGPSGSPGSSGPSGSSGSSSPEQNKQSEKELLLSLDPNNPEHVSAYAETQGGLPIDVARKMLMIHQDAFIEQLKRDGMNVDHISTQRGSHAQPNPSIQSPVQQTSTTQQAPPSPVPPPSMRQDVPPTYPDIHPNTLEEQQSHQPPNDIEYAEYHEVEQPDKISGSQPVRQQGQQPSSQNGSDNQQVEMMKIFASDIGKVMGEMLNKIETINNTVFTLQNEMNDIKKQGQQQSASMDEEIHPRVPHHKKEYSPEITDMSEMTKAPTGPQTIGHTIPSYISPPIMDRTRQYIDTPSLDTFEENEEQSEDRIIGTSKPELRQELKPGLNIERSEDFFEEDVIDVSNFKQELEEETRLGTEKLRQNMQSSETVQPTTQTIPPVTVIQPPLIEHSTDANKFDNTPIISNDKISEDKTSDDKNNDKFVTPIKKVGIHKKAEYRNLRPSFKKGEGKESKQENKEENKQENNI